jgi:gliding motility-associated-like protein
MKVFILIALLIFGNNTLCYAMLEKKEYASVSQSNFGRHSLIKVKEKNSNVVVNRDLIRSIFKLRFENPISLIYDEETSIFHEIITCELSDYQFISCLKGCAESFTSTIYLNEIHGVNIPTGFSPNNDGNNDVLRAIIGADVEYFTIYIYDRWGNKILQTNDFKFSWDGTFNGQLVSSGAYPYVLDIFYFDGKQENKSGNITVIR